jgi:thioredoxin 1
MKTKAFKWILLLLALVLMVLLFTQINKPELYLSHEIRSQPSAETQKAVHTLIDSLSNYQTNGQQYQISYLEFGSTGCVACKKMESVMQEVKDTFPGKVKVVFLNVLKPENRKIMKFYGVAVIPSQILLNRDGQELFRHTGYYSFDDLRKELDEYLADQ